MDKITIRSDRDTDYTFMYKGEETTKRLFFNIFFYND